MRKMFNQVLLLGIILLPLLLTGCTAPAKGPDNLTRNVSNDAIPGTQAVVQSTEYLNFEGFEELTRGNNQMALDYFNQALSQENQNAIVMNNIGYTFGKMGKYEDAIHYYTRAINSNPHDEVFYLNRGDTYYQMGNYKESQESFVKARSINPNLDWDMFPSCDINKADYRITHPVALDPTNAEAWIQKGYEAGDHLDFNCSLYCYNRSIAISPDSAAAWNNRGVLQAWNHDFDGARASFDTAIALDPTNVVYVKNKNALDRYTGYKGLFMSVEGELYTLGAG
jgi:tetratricopeptide (TPR) repeat protein